MEEFFDEVTLLFSVLFSDALSPIELNGY
jgi:hypothetical protein